VIALMIQHHPYRAREPQAQTCSSSCSYRLHLLRSWSLRQTRGGPENGDNESFTGSLRDELLNGEIFYSLAKARVLIEA